jgi:hypothetical protein
MLTVAMLTVVMLIADMLFMVTLTVILLSVVMLTEFRLSDIILNVVAPILSPFLALARGLPVKINQACKDQSETRNHHRHIHK